MSADATSRPDVQGADVVQALVRGLAVLASFSRDQPTLTVSEAARLTGITRPTARRVLLTLESLGYVRGGARGFVPTPRILELGHGYLASLDLATFLRPEMERLVEQARESCSAAVLDGTDIVYVARVPTERIMTIALGTGTRLPAHCTSLGRVLLAALPPDERAARLEQVELTARTPHTLTDRGQLLAELDQVASRGWSMVDQELELGVRSASVPLRDGAGQVIAALNLGANAARVPATRLREQLLPLLVEAGDRITAQLALR